MRLRTWEKLALGAILLGMTCAGCAQSRVVPMTLRPDTRAIWAVHIDSTPLMETLQILQAGLPNEAAVCYHGELRDTVFESPEGERGIAKIIVIHSVTPAVPDSVDLYHVYFTGLHAGCVGEIAFGHSHPHVDICDQSDDDARLLFGDPKALVSLAWCQNGEVNLLWQDGRRSTHRWRP